MSDLRDLATLCKEIDCLTAQVDALRKERDEARRMFCKTLCKFIGDTPGLAETFANDQGWDCYKGLIR
jgi:hypothetical protein